MSFQHLLNPLVPSLNPVAYMIFHFACPGWMLVLKSQDVKICCAISDGIFPQEPCLLVQTDGGRARLGLRNLHLSSTLFI